MNNIIFRSKRKSSVCRLHSSQKNQDHNFVNDKKLEDFFSDIPFYVMKIYNVLKLFELESEVKFKCRVRGGGKTAQADSIRYALAKFIKNHFKQMYSDDEEKFAEINLKLRKNKLLTVDSRNNEPKHYGRLKSRCKRQRSKR